MVIYLLPQSMNILLIYVADQNPEKKIKVAQDIYLAKHTRPENFFMYLSLYTWRIKQSHSIPCADSKGTKEDLLHLNTSKGEI